MNLERLKKLISDEEGAVTVDWVVLSAVVLGLTVMAANTLSEGALNVTGSVSDHMTNWSHE